MADTIDSLSIVISADTSKATKSVNALIKKLGTLRNTFKSLNNLHGGIRPLVKGLKDIAKIDFSGAEKSLESLATILSKIDSKKLEQIAKAQEASATTKAVAQQTPTKEPSLLEKSQTELGAMAKLSSSMNVANYDEVATQIEAFVQKMEMNVKMYGDKFENVHKKAKLLLDKTIARVRKNYDSGYGGGEMKDKKGNPMGNFMKRVGNRLAFSLVRLIVQAIKDLIKQMISVFARIDEGFNKVVSEAYSSIKYLKRAIEASFAPVIQLLAPIITMIGQVLGDVLNKVAELSAMIGGQDYYYKAQYSVEDYADSLDEANKKLTASFDQLNVLSGTEDDTEGFIKVQLENANSGLKSFVSLIKSIKPILDIIADSLFALPLQLVVNVLERLSPFIVSINSILETIIDLLVAIVQSVFAILGGDFQKLEQIWKEFGDKVKELWQGQWWNEMVSYFNSYKEKFDSIIGYLSNLTPEKFKATGLMNVGGTSTGDKIGKIALGVLTGGLSFLFTGTGFATGGFPEDGLFMANHNELVGKFANGKTAVANNEQITQGIYQAVLQAMRESGNGGEIVIKIDGKEIARAVNKENANMGTSFLTGGAINYGKL